LPRIKGNIKQRVLWAVKIGKLKRKPCVICGNKKVEGHHEDYNKPFEVLWLCKKHHLARHGCYKETAIAENLKELLEAIY
jgi:hypothetical protein